jgi:hypothetical protein
VFLNELSFLLLEFSKNRDKMSIHFHDLKDQMKHLQELMRKKLTKLTMETDEVIKMLRLKSDKVNIFNQFSDPTEQVLFFLIF